jgi:hypothetical protein
MRFRSVKRSVLARPLLALFVFATLSIAMAQTAPSTVNFRSQSALVTSSDSPGGAVTGDFNEDGRVDFAVIDSFSVTIMQNDGNFQFSPASTLEGGGTPLGIVAGNFNSDTHQDLAVTDGNANSLIIYLGHGNGTFAPGVVIPVPGTPVAITGANLRNDGRTQLVVMECAPPDAKPCALDVFQSDSAGAFDEVQQILLPTTLSALNPGSRVPNVNAIASDDFDLDNKPDVAIGLGTRVMVFRNTSAFDGVGNAHLTLQTSINTPNGGTINALTSGHFNTGAAPDLAFDVLNPGNTGNTDYVFLNNGNGTFFRKQSLTGTRFAVQMAAADINGDFIQDLVSVGLNGNEVGYALGRRDGTFGPLQHFKDPSLGEILSGIVIRDLNRDSRHDLIVTSRGTPPGNSGFTILMLNLNAAPNCPAPGSNTVSVAVCSITPSTNAFTVKASGNSPNGVKRVEVWVDGTKRTEAFNDQINARVSVAGGTHRVTLVAVDRYDAVVKRATTVNVP